MARVVLVVDDDPLVLETTATLLAEVGFEVITAASGAEALIKLEADQEDQRIEILITDIIMPGMDGYELAQRSQRIRGQLKVIALSGHEIEGNPFPLIRKPFLRQDLIRAMKQTH